MRLALLLLVLSAAGVGQGPQSLGNPGPGSAPRVEQVDPLVRQTYEIVDRVLEFRDRVYRIRTLTLLAGVVCTRDQVEGVALFERSASLLKDLESLASDGADGRRGPDRAFGLRQQILSGAKSCDPTLAGRLAAAPAPQKPKPRAPSPASPASIVRMKQEVKECLSGQHKDIARAASILRTLQQSDQASAADLLQQAIVEMRGLPSVDIRDLLAVGEVVFTSRSDVSGNSSGAHYVESVWVPFLDVKRPGITDSLTVAYLDMAVIILSHPPNSTGQAWHIIAAGKVLGPLVQQYLPERWTLLDRAMKELAQTTPPAPDEYNPGAAADPKSERAQSRIEAMPKNARRDNELATLAQGIANPDSFPRAYALAGQIANDDTRTSLLNYLNLAEGYFLLKQNRFDEAETLAHSMRPGAARCLLLLNVDDDRSQRQEAGAHPNVSACLDELPQLPAKVRPAIQVAAAKVLARGDPEHALFTLQLAVEGYNRLAEDGFKDFESVFHLWLGNCYCSLIGPGRVYPGDFAPAVLALMPNDPLGTQAVVSALKDEGLLGNALVAVLSARQRAAVTPEPARKMSQ